MPKSFFLDKESNVVQWLSKLSRKKWTIPTTILFVVGIVILSYFKTKEKSIGSDYYVFWKAGLDFFNGNDLYNFEGDVRPYIYPPFAAFIFQLFAIFPFKLSVNLFFIFNALILFPLSIILLKELSDNFGFGERSKMAIILSVVLTLKYFWLNLGYCQINFLLFTLVLVGIYCVSIDKPHWALVWIGIAVHIKIIPIFLFLYIFIMNIRSRKVWFWGAATGFLGLLIPVIFRGIEPYIRYYEAFLQNYKDGGLVLGYSNSNLRTFFLKVFHPDAMREKLILDEFTSTLHTANIVTVFLSVILLYCIYLSIRRRKPWVFLMVSAQVIIFSHLVSGITWSAHLVTSMFYLFPFFLIDKTQLRSLAARIVYYLLFGICIFLAIEGKDVVGKSLFKLLRMYDIFTIHLLIFFFYYAFMVVFNRKRYFSAKYEH